MKTMYVYIMASESGVLYVGATNHINRRVMEHKAGEFEGFTKKYNIKKLVYCETTEHIRAALDREKQIKGWLRKKKIDLIESTNPHWKDLASEWKEG
jgi:putative endonuclease